jgi:transposase
MSQFPSADHAASWARLPPGQYESAGKRRSSQIGKGQSLPAGDVNLGGARSRQGQGQFSGRLLSARGRAALDERLKDRLLQRLQRRIAQLGYTVLSEHVIRRALGLGWGRFCTCAPRTTHFRPTMH